MEPNGAIMTGEEVGGSRPHKFLLNYIFSVVVVVVIASIFFLEHMVVLSYDECDVVGRVFAAMLVFEIPYVPCCCCSLYSC